MTRPTYAYERRRIVNDAGDPETWWEPIGVILAPQRGPDGLVRFVADCPRTHGRPHRHRKGRCIWCGHKRPT